MAIVKATGSNTFVPLADVGGSKGKAITSSDSSVNDWIRLDSKSTLDERADNGQLVPGQLVTVDVPNELIGGVSASNVSNHIGVYRIGNILIQTGLVAIVGGNGTMASTPVTFDIPYAFTPNIQISTDSGSIGTQVLQWSASQQTRSGFTANLMRTNFIATSLLWTAIGIIGDGVVPIRERDRASREVSDNGNNNI